ncbi:Mrp/NBP35 family ATP-binding protein [Rhodocaloribacter sp.]
MAITVEQVIDALGTVVEPERGKDIVRLRMVKDLRVEGDTVRFTLVLPNPASPFARTVEDAVTRAIRNAAGADVRVDVSLDNEMIGLGDDLMLGGAAETPSSTPEPLSLIAVASGKGGVGKSTVAVNLAVALAKQGYDVGLVDTDIYGPSIPTMFGLKDARPTVNEARKIVPLRKYGVRLLSMGFLVDPDKAVIWRGPMVTSAVQQFLGDTAWGELDFLIMDLPPGTGDIQLTIVQTVSLAGVVIVSTPQDVALADARKGVAMFEQVNVPVLGIVENMAYFTPPDLPDRKYYLFGEGGARRLAERLGVAFLGEVPIDQSLREHCDAGTPVVAEAPESPVAQAFTRIAERTARQTAIRNATLPATEKIEILHR